MLSSKVIKRKNNKFILYLYGTQLSLSSFIPKQNMHLKFDWIMSLYRVPLVTCWFWFPSESREIFRDFPKMDRFESMNASHDEKITFLVGQKCWLKSNAEFLTAISLRIFLVFLCSRKKSTLSTSFLLMPPYINHFWEMIQQGFSKSTYMLQSCRKKCDYTKFFARGHHFPKTCRPWILWAIPITAT